jgi:hypothetical protein
MRPAWLGEPNPRVRPVITCADGFRLSVQASEYHYCTPRDNDGPWLSMEVGFPSERPEPWETWGQYAEEPNEPTQTVYGRVPVDVIDALIESHGGAA